jgi:hypothetical protein
MRGSTTEQVEILSALTPGELVPRDHPIRRIKVIVDAALAELHAEFDARSPRTHTPALEQPRTQLATIRGGEAS